MNSLDDIEIDNLLEKNNLFKPLTEGLGFHHSIKNEKEVVTSLKQKSIDLKSDLEKKAKSLSTSISTKPFNKTLENPHLMGDLRAFYAKPESADIDLMMSNQRELHVSDGKQNIQLYPAKLELRFLAWLVDSLLVAVMLSIAFLAAVFTSNIPLSFFRDNVLNLDIGFFVIAISMMFYVFYFSFFDKTKFSTPGKRIFGLGVKNINGNDITFIQSINRSLICCMSILTLGLASILRFQDRLTQSVVISK